jgi:ABC-type phosphate transport system ATPase subunit
MGKITETELKRIDMVRQDALEVASSLGELTYQKKVIEIQEDEIKAQIIEIKKREAELFEELKTKYGNVTINIETGDFN